MNKPAKITIVVYGCAKNIVDAEEMAARLMSLGYSVTPEIADSDLIVVHTCGFIQDAKKESIDGILRACQTGVPVLVTGCLSQRYPHQLMEEIPELRGVAGTAAPREIVRLVEEALTGKKVLAVGSPGRGAPGRWDLRLYRERRAWAYVRISEGCRHHCTYCAIPSIRGPLCSRTIDDIKKEVQELALSGIREVNLIAQDLTDYGVDLYGRRALPDLIEAISSVEDLRWIRLLYLRPDGVTGDLASSMTLPKVLPYADLPVEHGSPKILRRMARPDRAQIETAVSLLRAKLPHIALRTTIIAGFPGETEADLTATLDLVQNLGFVRVAAFPYSTEDGTPAALLEDSLIDSEKRRRAEMIRRKGLRLARTHSLSLVGQVLDVLITRPSTRPGYMIGRGYHQAPEVDGKIYVKTEGSCTTVGDIVKVKVIRSGVLDLFARL